MKSNPFSVNASRTYKEDDTCNKTWWDQIHVSGSGRAVRDHCRKKKRRYDQINQSINQSIRQSINLTIYRSNNQSINRSNDVGLPGDWRSRLGKGKLFSCVNHRTICYHKNSCLEFCVLLKWCNIGDEKNSPSDKNRRCDDCRGRSQVVAGLHRLPRPFVQNPRKIRQQPKISRNKEHNFSTRNAAKTAAEMGRKKKMKFISSKFQDTATLTRCRRKKQLKSSTTLCLNRK